MQISGLPVSTAFGAADVLAIEINGVTYKITGATIAAALQSMGDYVTAQDIVNNLTTTDDGYVLDARQGKALLDAIESLGAADVGAVAADQGAANAGKALVVGSDGNVTTGKTVRPDAAQTLTAAEQAQARGNIGAASATELAAEAAARETGDTELKSAITQYTGNAEIQFSDPALKQYINTSGSTVSWDSPSVSVSTNIKWAVVECSPGDEFTINGKGGNADRLWAFADLSKNILDKAAANATATNLLITAPENAAYLIINDETNKKSYIGELIQDKLNGEIAKRIAVDENFNSAIEELGSRVGAEYFPWVLRNTINSSGNVVQSNGFAYTHEYYDVDDISGIFNQTNDKGYNNIDTDVWVHEYNSSKVWLRRIKTQPDKLYIFNADCKYFRLAYGYAGSTGVVITQEILAQYFKISIVTEMARKDELSPASVTNKVVRINNAAEDNSSAVMISRATFTGGSNIQIVITGRNIFDGVIQSGYWNGASVVTSDTSKCSVNPTYVNGGEIIVPNKTCRVTEFLPDGTYNTSYIAVGRQPYKICNNTGYVHFSANNADMEALCIYPKDIPDIDIPYKSKTLTHTVRTDGPTIYAVPVTLYSGYNSVYVYMLNSPSITVKYHVDFNAENEIIFDNVTAQMANEYFAGIKTAKSGLYTAHRGSTIQAPENTTFAIVQAFKNGFRNVEIDVRFTSDNIPVLLHDSTIDRTSNGTGAVSSFTYNQLLTYDFGSWMGRKFNNARIPTLDQACRLCRNLGIRPHLDTAGNTSIAEDQINIICDILKKNDLLDGCVWYLRTTGSGIQYIKNYYSSAGKKFYAYWQASGFGEASILSLLNNINNTLRDYNTMYDMGVSINISDLTSDIKTAAIGFANKVPIAIYFVDSYNDFVAVSDYPYALYCTNRADIPYLSAQYYAPGSIW